MDRLTDIIDFFLGRRRGMALVLSALAFFERIERKLVLGMQHIDTEIEGRKQRIEQEQQAIGQLTQVRATAASALTNIAKLTGAEKH